MPFPNPADGTLSDPDIYMSHNQTKTGSHIGEILQFAIALADVAEREILRHYRTATTTLKADGSDVTQADREAEEAMRAIIAVRYPDHQILGEEFGGPTGPTDQPTWILDPIDGTTSYALGIPMFGTLIGYLENNEPVVGVIHLPAMSESIFAARGLGCWYKRRGDTPKPIRVAAARDLKEAFVSASSVNPSDIQPPASGDCYRLSALIPRVRKFRFVTDCVQYSLVAQGRLDAALDLEMNPWDIAALVPCIEEAGGVTADLDGNREGIVWRPSLLAASNPRLLDQILKVVRNRQH